MAEPVATLIFPAALKDTGELLRPTTNHSNHHPY